MVFPFRELLGKLVIFLPGDFYPRTDTIISGLNTNVRIPRFWPVIMLLLPLFNKFLSIRYSHNIDKRQTAQTLQTHPSYRYYQSK